MMISRPEKRMLIGIFSLLSASFSAQFVLICGVTELVAQVSITSISGSKLLEPHEQAEDGFVVSGFTGSSSISGYFGRQN